MARQSRFCPSLVAPCSRRCGTAHSPCPSPLNRSFYCTVSIAVPVTPPEFAPIVLVPAPLQFAEPATLGAFAIVATGTDDELQWLVRVISCVLASLNVPVATKSWAVPTVHVGAAGVSASETRVPVPTVSVVLPLTPDAEAVIVTVPFFLPCAIPDERTEARLGFDDFHETPLRLVATLPSLNVPVAVNLIDVPFSMRGFAGETAIETR